MASKLDRLEVLPDDLLSCAATRDPPGKLALPILFG